MTTPSAAANGQPQVQKAFFDIFTPDKLKIKENDQWYVQAAKVAAIAIVALPTLIYNTIMALKDYFFHVPTDNPIVLDTPDTPDEPDIPDTPEVTQTHSWGKTFAITAAVTTVATAALYGVDKYFEFGYADALGDKVYTFFNCNEDSLREQITQLKADNTTCTETLAAKAGFVDPAAHKADWINPEEHATCTDALTAKADFVDPATYKADWVSPEDHQSALNAFNGFVSPQDHTTCTETLAALRDADSSNGGNV